MTTIEEIRQWCPNANHAPDPNCPRCGGTGIAGKAKEIKVRSDGMVTTEALDKPAPCICVFVDHQFCSIVRDALREVCRQYRADATPAAEAPPDAAGED
jgi:hypothetical protein